MGLEWLPRDDELKDHGVGGEQYWGTHDNPPCTVYEKKPLRSSEGEVVEGLYTAWITLNNPRQYNSYTTEMVKGVIAGFANASLDRSVVAVVFTGAGDRAFCTGGNTKEYAEYYSPRPTSTASTWISSTPWSTPSSTARSRPSAGSTACGSPGGQEIGMACDLAIASDLAIFGQAGPRHGSAPGRRFHRLPALVPVDGGRHVQLHLLRDVVGSYKMKLKGLVTKVVPVLKVRAMVRAQPVGRHRSLRRRRRGRLRRDEDRRRRQGRPRSDQGAAGRLRAPRRRGGRDGVALHESLPGLPAEVDRRHPRQEEVLLGPDQARQPPLAGREHVRRGLPRFHRLQQPKADRGRYHRLRQIPPAPRRGETLDEALFEQVLAPPKPEEKS